MEVIVSNSMNERSKSGGAYVEEVSDTRLMFQSKLG